MKLLDYALRLFWETEAEGAGEFHLLPIARLKLDTRQPVALHGFRPSPGDDGRFRCCPRQDPFHPGASPFPLPPSRHIQGEGGPRRVQHKRRPARLFSCPQIPQPLHPHSGPHGGGDRPSPVERLRDFAPIHRGAQLLQRTIRRARQTEGWAGADGRPTTTKTWGIVSRPRPCS